MLTYLDLVNVGENAKDIAVFMRQVINEHRASPLYQLAKMADDYDRGLNTTITQYQKMITTVTGQKIPDEYAVTHRAACNFFAIYTSQLSAYLLGNGVNWGKPESKERMGKSFDARLQELGKSALCGGVAFGYWNADHAEAFSVLNFAPLYDEETGALMAGVRWWQIDDKKPLRATLYTPNGLTEFMWAESNYVPDDKRWIRIEDTVYCQNPRPYVFNAVQNEADGAEIVDGKNYKSFPIVPMYANRHHQSELIGLQEKIDAYDMIASGFIDDLDQAQIYWIIKGAGGMDDPDLVHFLRRLKLNNAAAPMDGQEVEAHEVNIPYEAREKLLDRLESQLYKDAMIMNPEDIRGGAITATQIRAAYERQNVKTDEFEFCVLDFLYGMMELAGVVDEPTFDRSTVINRNEEIQNLVLSAPYLGQEYVTRKILALNGDIDKYDEVQKQVDAEGMERLGGLD